jgi:hypothetical protein
MPKALDLMGHVYGVEVVDSVLNIIRHNYDTLIVDAGNRSGPAICSLIRNSDEVILMVGEGALEASAVSAYLSYMSHVLDGNQNVRLLSLGGPLDKPTLQQHFKEASLTADYLTSDSFWELEHLPFDLIAKDWAGTGETIYSRGGAELKAALTKNSRTLSVLNVAGCTLDEDRSITDRLAKPKGLKDKLYEKGMAFFSHTSKAIPAR